MKLNKLTYKTQELFNKVKYQVCCKLKIDKNLTRYFIVDEIKGKINLKKEKYNIHKTKITQNICVINDNLSNCGIFLFIFKIGRAHV